MKYIVCQEPKRFELKQKELPQRNSGEALLKIHRVGICGTDLHAYGGNQAFFKYPRILGHELAAEVLEIDPNDKGINQGDKVIVMPYVSCGSCIACRRGKTNCCANIKVMGVHADGGMQEVISVRSDLLIKANELSYNEMAIVEPLAIGAHALRRSEVKAGDYVVVIGCGPIGIGLMKLAQIIGANVIALDVNDDRLGYAVDQIGVQHAFNVMKDPVAQIAQLTNNDMATAVFDATGNKRALETGIDYMAHGGEFILVGLSKDELCYSHPKIHAKETTLKCSRNATVEDFDFVIKHLNEFPTDSFITHQVHYTEMIADFDSWLDPKTGVIKAMVNFD